MNRKEYIKKTLHCGICAGALLAVDKSAFSAAWAPSGADDCTAQVREKEFVQNWLADLLKAMENTLDRETCIALIEQCGKACYNRYSFKQDIAAQGSGDLVKLIEAYKKNFEIWQDDESVHIRYGEVSSGCYCPAAKYRPATPNDMHCECTRMTHQTIFETALQRPFKVDILESVRRGGKTCHFLVHLT